MTCQTPEYANDHAHIPGMHKCQQLDTKSVSQLIAAETCHPYSLFERRNSDKEERHRTETRFITRTVSTSISSTIVSHTIDNIMEDNMSYLINLGRRASILGALVALATLTPTLAPSSLAAEDRPEAAAATASMSGANVSPAGSTTVAVPAPELCNAVVSCQVARTSRAIELDFGGPSIHIEYFTDDD